MTGRCTARYSRAACCVLGAASILEPHRAALLTSWHGVLSVCWAGAGPCSGCEQAYHDARPAQHG